MQTKPQATVRVIIIITSSHHHHRHVTSSPQTDQPKCHHRWMQGPSHITTCMTQTQHYYQAGADY